MRTRSWRSGIVGAVVLAIGIAVAIVALVQPGHATGQSPGGLSLANPPSTTPIAVPSNSSYGVPTPTTPQPIPQSQEPAAQAGPAAPLVNPPLNPLTHSAAPQVAIPNALCNDSDLSASLTSNGPYQGMGTVQYIITVSSSVACQLSGYPTLHFDGATSSIQDGGTVGSANPPSAVAAGPGNAVSFLIEFFTHGTCNNAAGLAFGLSTEAPTVPVALNSKVVNSWIACATTKVSPFEQGNAIGQYA
jgi:hypothetical protein